MAIVSCTNKDCKNIGTTQIGVSGYGLSIYSCKAKKINMAAVDSSNKLPVCCNYVEKKKGESS